MLKIDENLASWQKMTDNLGGIGNESEGSGLRKQNE